MTLKFYSWTRSLAS